MKYLKVVLDFFSSLKETFVSKPKRIFEIAKKPTAEEAEKIAKVTALMLIIVGIIGMIISLIFTYI